ncbi:MAG: RtcB family protein [Undibacterium sp.]
MITNKTLTEWGFKPGVWFKIAVSAAINMRKDGASDEQIIKQLMKMTPPEAISPPTIPLRPHSIPYWVFLEAVSELERENYDQVIAAMNELMRVPTVVSGAIMPDACPAGIIPVGGVVATKNAIHPGFHSEDVCCSMMMTVFDREVEGKAMMDAAFEATHFGPGGRKEPIGMSDELVAAFRGNAFLSDLVEMGHSQMGTQGDGNHFLFAGWRGSDGLPAIVTHHGSRGIGAELYKKGMNVAKKWTKIHSPQTPEKASWIVADSPDGIEYWYALQIVRNWTRQNHAVIHARISNALGVGFIDSLWNEHNFVFCKDDGLYYHAKGATPSFAGFSPDDTSGRCLIPMNMSEPILIVGHANNADALGFSPHGAGRNMSRTKHKANLASGDSRGLSDRDAALVVDNEVGHLDIRPFSGVHDLSEMPSAYKSADKVRGAIKKFGLASIIDEILPYGSIMAGEHGQFWRRKESAKRDG